MMRTLAYIDTCVTPAKAGVQLLRSALGSGRWMPAFAGMTEKGPGA